MKRSITLVLGIHTVLFMSAQENIGIRNSNFAGVQSVFLNPSSIADSKLSWDVNLVSVGTLFDNNFFFIPKGSLPAFGFSKIISGIKNENLFKNHFDPRSPGKLYNIILSNEVIGPSVYFKIAQNKEIGFTIASRVYANINDVPGHLAQNAFADFRDKNLWNTNWHDNMTQMNSMGWLEYGFHYAAVIYARGNHEWKAGISLNYLQGIVAGYVKNAQLNYYVPDSTKVILTHSSVDYGGTIYGPEEKTGRYRDLNHGFGFGGNIGFTYVFFRDQVACNNTSDNEKWAARDNGQYTFRIGVSLIDMGSIYYNRNARAYHVQTDSFAYSLPSQTNVAGASRSNPDLNAIFDQTDSIRSVLADHFNMALPTAFSIQADWNFSKNFFVNATIIKGFGHGGREGIVRPDSYSLTPRYETSWFEASMPLSLLYYHRWQPRVGLALRVGYFFFGGDAPGSLFGLNNFERTDFYAGIHFFTLEKKHKQHYLSCPDIKN